MDAIRSLKNIAAVSLTAGSILTGSAYAHHTPETQDTIGSWFHYRVDVRDESRKNKIRHNMQSYLDGQIDSIYNWGGFGKQAKWDVRRWRKFEIREMSFDELFRHFRHIKFMEWGHKSTLYSVTELAREIYGSLQWREAQFRPEHHKKNEIVTSAYSAQGRSIKVETGAENYRGFYDDWEKAREDMIRGEMKAGTRWIGANWIDFTLHRDAYGRNEVLHDAERANAEFTYRFKHNAQRLIDYFADTLAVEHLEWHGHLTRAERILHYRGEIDLRELF